MAVARLAAVAAWVPCRSWGWAAVPFGPHRGLSVLLARIPQRAPRWLPGLITQELEVQMVTQRKAHWGNGEKMFFL
ncbi:ABHD10 isoform 2 [Pan troglodytes]|uniref:Abhydrolase domain containing 10, depalmitoylase n=2 Tax=Homininae TaxID=207598 RepID=F8WBQ6_HUMAN|nr:abhydrolase domain containing 10, depalmitoylase [Homo sapiens]KAI4030885.1 abhydrolase domain containing 10, depalmitoylase [Homo sapiens]PNI64149.1 ABHD10 isoform 2 [Pan troglodytes]